MKVALDIPHEVLVEIKAVQQARKMTCEEALVHVLKQATRNLAPRTAVILAGGEGTRLRPLTYEIPKPLIPVHGKTLLEHLLDLFKKHHVHDIVLAIGYQKEKIRSHFGDGKRYGISITYLEENEPLGTAGPLLLRKFTKPFIVTNGDELKDIDIEGMYAQHLKTKAAATIALLRVPDPSAYGVAALDGLRITRFVEKPPKGTEPSQYINSGFYILNPEALRIIPKGHSMLEKDVFPKLAQRGRLYGYLFEGQWYDTGTMERYEKAIKGWKDISDSS